MGFNNKELEVKLIAGSISFKRAVDIIQAFGLKKSFFNKGPVMAGFDVSIGKSKDYYWSPKQTKAQFVRVRTGDCGNGQITTKSTFSKEDGVSRVEIDVAVKDGGKQAVKLFKFLFGKPKVVEKRYHVRWFGAHNNISAYVVLTKAGESSVIFEAEATSKKSLRAIVEAFSDHLTYCGVDVSWLRSSVYEMFVEGKKPKTANIQQYLDLRHK